VGGGGGSSAVDLANCATSDCGDTNKKEAELVSVCASIAHLHLHRVIATLVLDEGAKGRETGKEGNRGTDI